MRRSRFLALLLLAGGLTGTLGACQQPSTSDVSPTDEGVLRLGSVEAVDTVSRAVAPSDRPLVVDGFRGRIVLRGAAQETATLQFVKRARGADAEEARSVLGDVSITESGSQEAYTYTLETGGGDYAAVDVTGTVPRGTEVRVEQSVGPVVIEGIEGAITVEHEHGPVTIRGAGGSVTVEIRNGDMEVQSAALPPDASVSLRTSNGDLTLGLPVDASAKISAQTSVGVIRTQGLALSNEQFAPQEAGGRYEAQLGPGEAPVDLRTENGSIEIAAADTTATDTAAAAPPRPGPATDVSEPEQRTVPPSDTTVAPADTAQADTAQADRMRAPAPDSMGTDTAQ
jgi:hypothetical protein